MDSSQEITQLKALSQCKDDKLHCKKSWLENFYFEVLQSCHLFCGNSHSFQQFLHAEFRFFNANFLLKFNIILCYSNILMAK